VGGIMVLLAALAVLVIGVYPDPVIAVSKYAFFAMSPELQQFIFTLVQSGFN
jgi:NADH-quinone oxidoreductase subunit N